METGVKWGAFLLSIALLVGGYIYGNGQRDADNAQTKAIVAEMRADQRAKNDKDTAKEQRDEVRYAQGQEVQATILSRLSDLVQRVTTIEHSRR